VIRGTVPEPEVKKEKRPMRSSVFLSRVWKGLRRNYCFDMAAELGFYFLYSLFPFIIFLVAMTSLVPIASSPKQVLASAKEFLPDYLFTLAGPTLVDLIFTPRKLLAAGTLFLAFWAASSAVSSLMAALNRIHSVREQRSYWRTAGISLVLTSSLVIAILTAVTLLVTGPMVGNWLINKVGFSAVLGMAVWGFRWGIWVMLMFLVLAMLFSYGPNIKRPFKLFSPGAFVTLGGQFLFSEVFRLYLENSGSYNLFYGAAGGIVGLMTWLYMMGLMILTGAQVNHELGKMN